MTERPEIRSGYISPQSHRLLLVIRTLSKLTCHISAFPRAVSVFAGDRLAFTSFTVCDVSNYNRVADNFSYSYLWLPLELKF